MSDRIEVDDIRFKLREVFSFYGKDLDDSAERVWINALSGHSADAVIQAFDRHIAGASGNASSYAPKPRHIIELLPRQGGSQAYCGPADNPAEQVAEPRVAKAWVVFMRRVYGFSPHDANPEVQLSFEQACEICNQQAAKHNQPDAIPDKYKIPRYWDQTDDLLEAI